MVAMLMQAAHTLAAPLRMRTVLLFGLRVTVCFLLVDAVLLGVVYLCEVLDFGL